MEGAKPEKNYHKKIEKANFDQERRPAITRDEFIAQQKEHLLNSINTVENDYNRLRGALETEENVDLATVEEMINAEGIEAKRSKEQGKEVSLTDEEIEEIAWEEVLSLKKERDSLKRKPAYAIIKLEQAVNMYRNNLADESEKSQRGRNKLERSFQRFGIDMGSEEADSQIANAVKKLEDRVIKPRGHAIIEPLEDSPTQEIPVEDAKDVPLPDEIQNMEAEVEKTKKISNAQILIEDRRKQKPLAQVEQKTSQKIQTASQEAKDIALESQSEMQTNPYDKLGSFGREMERAKMQFESKVANLNDIFKGKRRTPSTEQLASIQNLKGQAIEDLNTMLHLAIEKEVGEKMSDVEKIKIVNQLSKKILQGDEPQFIAHIENIYTDLSDFRFKYNPNGKKPGFFGKVKKFFSGEK